MSAYRPSIAERITWTSGQLKASDAKVLAALASCGDWMTGRNCRPYLSTLVSRAGVSEATVTRSLRRLEADGWTVVTARRHRRPTSYDICADRLATTPPKEQQMTIAQAHASDDVGAQNEHQRDFGTQNEHQPPGLGAQNEHPISLKDLISQRTHTARAREDDDDAELPLIGETPLPRCQHPHAHAWCEGRVHVPRDLHFEMLDQLGTRPGESPSAKAGRLINFYADTMAHLPPEADIGNAYTFWKAAYQAWVGQGARRRGDPRPRVDIRGGSVCPHEPLCETRHACIDRMITDAREERQRQSG